ncbi:hypothetical protein Goarm_016313 [Gossypium armourianum]|uniref:Uncharacterized protein n=1 Tax=Gossypium armourianum TaxID=34283 RepID=A0A7J9JEK7_9ROSI|nr:hypothetical protein [Gossypium armourianum]
MTTMKAPNSTNINSMRPIFEAFRFQDWRVCLRNPRNFLTWSLATVFRQIKDHIKKEWWNSVKYEETNSITGPWTQTYFLS